MVGVLYSRLSQAHDGRVLYPLLHVIGRVVYVLCLTLWYAAVGLAIVAAVVAVPYLLAMAMLWLKAHQ